MGSELRSHGRTHFLQTRYSLICLSARLFHTHIVLLLVFLCRNHSNLALRPRNIAQNEGREAHQQRYQLEYYTFEILAGNRQRRLRVCLL